MGLTFSVILSLSSAHLFLNLYHFERVCSLKLARVKLVTAPFAFSLAVFMSNRVLSPPNTSPRVWPTDYSFPCFDYPSYTSSIGHSLITLSCKCVSGLIELQSFISKLDLNSFYSFCSTSESLGREMEYTPYLGGKCK
jgi:hypothetical protein